MRKLNVKKCACGKELERKGNNQRYCYECDINLNKCTICSKEFRTYPSQPRKFCSNECYLKYHSRNIKEKTCKNCGKVFIKRNNIYCSVECSQKVRRLYQLNNGIRIQKPSIKIKKICLYCKNSFEIPKWKEKHKFCSFECSIKAHTHQPKYIKCLNCGRLTDKKSKRNKFFCSKLCKDMSQIGEKSHFWNNGASFKPYPINFTRMFKKSIKIRDNFICLKCGIHEEASVKIYKRKLHVHHIDYLKENTFKENCCTLCTGCNAEVNFNKKHWVVFFQSILAERYGYMYAEDGKIILNLEFERRE